VTLARGRGLRKKTRRAYRIDELKPAFNIYAQAGFSGGDPPAETRATRGVPKSEEHKAKIAEAHRGKRHSAESIARMRAAHRRTWDEMPAEKKTRELERLRLMGFRQKRSAA
jgi:hypothetical protein